MKKFSKILLLFLLAVISTELIKAQDEDYYNQGKFFISPDFGLIVGTITRIEVSPVLGYYVSDRLSLAAGFTYQYYKQSGDYFVNFKTNIYGPRAYASYILIKNLGEILPVQSNIEILTHLEYEALSLENKYFALIPSETGRFWFHTALIGGGISQTTSQRIKLNALILWDVDTSTLSPNSNPIIRIGIQIMFGKVDSYYY